MEFIFIWLLFGIGTSVIASNKGYDGCSYFILGVLLGPIGLLIAIFSSKKEKTNSQSTNTICKYCGFNNISKAPFCPGCGKDIKGFEQNHYIKIANNPLYKEKFQKATNHDIGSNVAKHRKFNSSFINLVLLLLTVITAILLIAHFSKN